MCSKAALQPAWLPVTLTNHPIPLLIDLEYNYACIQWPVSKLNYGITGCDCESLCNFVSEAIIENWYWMLQNKGQKLMALC